MKFVCRPVKLEPVSISSVVYRIVYCIKAEDDSNECTRINSSHTN